MITRRQRWPIVATAALLGLWAFELNAQPQPSAPFASAPPAPANSGPAAAPSTAPAAPKLPPAAKPPAAAKRPADGPRIDSSCSELIPKGATRPKVLTTVHEDAIAGYVVELKVVVEHGPGETVMPGGFRIERGASAMRVLEEQGWALPDPDGGAGPIIERPDADSDAVTLVTKLTVSFVPLPEKPGRRSLTLPPLPISVARASGDLMTLCTAAKQVVVEDPIANEVDPKVRGNPPPRPQRELWEAARTGAMIAAAAMLLGALLGWIFTRLNERFKPEPAKAKMLPWIAAVKELKALRNSSLLEDEKFDEYIDIVNDITRRYLGERYGFDGIESTSSEIRETLERVYPPIKIFDEVSDFLADTDLIKFAKVTPDQAQCEDALARAFEIVRATTPPGTVRIDGEISSAGRADA